MAITINYLGHEIELTQSAESIFDDFDFWEELANEKNALRQQSLQIAKFRDLFADFNAVRSICEELDNGKLKVSRLNDILQSAPKD